MKVPIVGVPISVGFNRGLLHIWPTSVKLSHSFDICTAWVWHCHCLSCLSLDDTMQRVCLEIQKINKQPLKHIIINKLDTKVNVVTKNHSDIWHISQHLLKESQEHVHLIHRIVLEKRHKMLRMIRSKNISQPCAAEQMLGLTASQFAVTCAAHQLFTTLHTRKIICMLKFLLQISNILELTFI